MLNKGAFCTPLPWSCALCVQTRAVRHHAFAEIFQLTKWRGVRTCWQRLTPHYCQVSYPGSSTSQLVSSLAKTPFTKYGAPMPFEAALPQRAANAHQELLKGQRRKLFDRIIAGHRTSGMLAFSLSSPKTGEMPKSKTYSKNWSLSISHYREQQTSWQKARQASNENTPIIALLVFLWTFIKTNTFKKYFSFD